MAIPGEHHVRPRGTPKAASGEFLMAVDTVGYVDPGVDDQAARQVETVHAGKRGAPRWSAAPSTPAQLVTLVMGALDRYHIYPDG